MTFKNSLDFGRQLMTALGLPPGGWERIVIVCDVNAIPRVYVKGFVPDDRTPAIVRAVADVTVSDDGDVTTLPVAEEIQE